MDEHRIGLKPVLRHVWANVGQRPCLPVQHRYEWLYVYGFVHPSSGRSFLLLMPTVSIPAFSAALHAFAIFAQAGETTDIRLLVDRAGWHGSKTLQVPENIRLLPQPAHSPEVQPTEHIWDEVREKHFHNRVFEDMDAVGSTSQLNQRPKRAGVVSALV